MATFVVSADDDDTYAGYNATILNSNGSNEFYSDPNSIWIILAIVCLWMLAIGLSNRRLRDVAEAEEQHRINKTKAQRFDPERRKNIIMSILLLRKITKIHADGGIEFSEESKNIAAQHEAPTKFILNNNLDHSHIDGKNDPSIGVVDNSSSTSKNEKEKANLNITHVEKDTPLDEMDYNENGEHSECVKTEIRKNSLEEGNNQEDNNLGIDCSICLNPFDVDDELAWSRKLRCQHVFHSDCLIPWLMKHDECPVCRTKLIDDEDFLENEASKKRSAIFSTSAEETLTITEENTGSAGDVEASTTVDEGRSLFSSSGNFFVTNGLVSFVRNTRYTRIISHPTDNLNHNMSLAISDEESTSSSNKRNDGLIEMMTFV